MTHNGLIAADRDTCDATLQEDLSAVRLSCLLMGSDNAGWGP